DGDDFFVAWSNNDLNVTQGVYSRTIPASGPPSEPILVIAGNDTHVESAAWDGSHYAVAYQARREDGFYAYRLMLTHAGLGDQLVISGAAPDQREVALAATPGRPLRAAYTRIATDPQYGYVSRLFTRDLVYARRRTASH
ncbi:MAG TPA: hypothetical protein VHU41_09895, partial [Thermoanaerobaculia bacterium]|nr:hypothetical protein [Thermoanaerobaculia bacterium]